MREFFFFFLYGMLTVTGVFLSVFWTRLAAHRLRAIDGAWRHDRYFWLAAALGFNSIGSVVLFGARAWGNIHYGLSRQLFGWEGMIIGIGLTVILGAKVMMVWLADLERPKPRWLWGMGAITIVWSAICIWLADF